MLGIFALSAALKDTELDKYQASLKLLDEQGFEYKKASNLENKTEIFQDAQYFSCGTLTERLSALAELKDCNQYLALKGGYGVQHCLEDLDKASFTNSSVYAYSDLTALFVYLSPDETIKLFHSPMLVELSTLDEAELQSFLGFLKDDSVSKAKLFELTAGLEAKLKSTNSIFIDEPVYLYGGNLSLLLSAKQEFKVNTGYKKILFIEECFEEAYKLERMLYAAENQGLFNGIYELWLGESKEALFNLGLLEKLAKKYNFNLVTELPFGHRQKFTLPIFQYYN